MVEQMTIRRAKNAEHKALMSLMLRAMRHGGSKSYSPELLAAWLVPGNEVFEFYLARNLFVAERQGKITGFGGWRPEIKKKNQARLASIYVEPGEEGKGIGGKILEILIEDMLEAGFVLARLYAMLNAHPFYLAHGFVDVEHTEIPVAKGVKAPVVIMTKLL